MASAQDARTLIGQITAAYNARDTDVLMGLYQPDVVYWSTIGEPRFGIDAVRRNIDVLHRRFPDERMSAKTIITDGDVIVVEFESTGTNPADPGYTIEFTEVFELRDGMVASVKVYLDPQDVEQEAL